VYDYAESASIVVGTFGLKIPSVVHYKKSGCSRWVFLLCGDCPYIRGLVSLFRLSPGGESTAVPHVES